jgi:cytidine deaminase
MRTFGESAPLQKLMKQFGFTVEAALDQVIKQNNSRLKRSPCAACLQVKADLTAMTKDMTSREIQVLDEHLLWGALSRGWLSRESQGV